VRNHAGGGQKINLFKKELLKHKDDSNKIIMFTDRYAYHPIVVSLFSCSQLFNSFIATLCACVCLQL